jgi:hypothetical protein
VLYLLPRLKRRYRVKKTKLLEGRTLPLEWPSLAVSSSERHPNEATRLDLPVLLARDPNRPSEKLLLRQQSRRSRMRCVLGDRLSPLCHPV